MPEYEIRVNGKSRTVDAPADMPVLWVLRDLLKMTGSKFGCGVGGCGSCTILVDGVEVRSCIFPIERVGNSEVTTIEGVSADGSHPLQKAFVEHDVSACGYCQGSKVLAALALLQENPDAGDEEIRSTLGTHICRCGTYNRMVAAVRSAAQEMK